MIRDPFTCLKLNSSNVLFQMRLPYWTKPTGYPKSNPRLDPSERTGVFIVAGQSNAAAYGVGAAFVAAHPTKIDSISMFDGGVYKGQDPGANIDGTGTSWLFRFADRLIWGGQFDHVIMVPIAMGSSSINDWEPGGVLSDFIPVAHRRCEALGMPVTALLWQQGESDGTMATATYQAKLQSVIDNSRAEGFNAPWFVAKSTYVAGNAYPNVRNACAAIVNGIDVFAGPDTDTLTGTTYREPGLTHFNGNGCDHAAALWEGIISAHFPR